MNASTVSHNTDIISLIANADFVVQLTLLVLVAFSINSWAIIIKKLTLLKKIDSISSRFEEFFFSGQSLEQLYLKFKNRTSHPLANIFINAIEELANNNKKINGSNKIFDNNLNIKITSSIENSRTLEITKLESGLNFLATIGSAATFIGLFGTVWGIMNSFKSIAAAKNATLAVVAPGIAEALLATAIGLITAIPAVIFYNYFVNRINLFTNKIDYFSNRLISLIISEFEGN